MDKKRIRNEMLLKETRISSSVKYQILFDKQVIFMKRVFIY